MAETQLATWLERKYLQWQMEHGRETVAAFAQYLGIQRSLLTMLMSGKRKSISRQTAQSIAERLGDYEIMDLLGYARPEPDELLVKLPPSLREPLLAAYKEYNEELVRRGITERSPEAEQIIKAALERHGVSFTITRSS